MCTDRMIEMGLSESRDARIRGHWMPTTISRKARQELVRWLVASVALMLAASFCKGRATADAGPQEIRI